jgi:hypothetical protein
LFSLSKSTCFFFVFDHLAYNKNALKTRNELPCQGDTTWVNVWD